MSRPDVGAVVFSKDRPLQLDALLRSIAEYAPDFYQWIYCLIRASDDEYRRGYEQLIETQDYLPASAIIEDGYSFDWELRTLLFLAFEEHDYVAFHCDDDVFFRKPDWYHPLNPAVTLSLRLSPESDYCQTRGMKMAPTGKQFWRWDEQAEGLDTGYPFSLDGHVYRCETVRTLLGHVTHIDGPNDLEHRGYTLMRDNPDGWGPFMLCGREQAVVSLTVNRVQDDYPNPCDGRPEWSPEALLGRWLDGEQLAFRRMDFSSVNAAHAVVPLEFERR